MVHHFQQIIGKKHQPLNQQIWYIYNAIQSPRKKKRFKLIRTLK